MMEIAHSHSQTLSISVIVCFDRDHDIIDYIKIRLLKFGQISFNC